MRRWLLGVVLVACSTPPSKPHEVYTPPDDEGSAVAYQQAHTPPPPDPHEARFDWDKLRADDETWLSKPFTGYPCDPRYQGAKPKGVECLPANPTILIAAKTLRVDGPDDASHVKIRVDRGSEAAIATSWFAVIVDPVGHPRGPWIHPDVVGPGSTDLTITLPLSGSGTGMSHVVLANEVPK